MAQHPDRESGGPRFEACVAVVQSHVEEVLNGAPPEVMTIDETGYFLLIAREEEDGIQAVAFPLLFPRVYALIGASGWQRVHVGDDELFRE